MTWREKVVVSILLLVARMLDEGQWGNEIKTLATHIAVNAPKPVDLDVPQLQVSGRA